MQYESIAAGRFVCRPNRFIAHIIVNGITEICHVKNTGRCRELLVRGARVILSKSKNPNRKTKYDLVAVYKGDKLINMDSQAPNRVFREWAESGGFLPDIIKILPEYAHGRSRLDFFVETKNARCLVEVKGVTLEENGRVLFPDAPTLRGLKHVQELTAAVLSGYACYVVFVIQMHGVECFSPNDKTDPAFSKALKRAAEAGVHVLAYDCLVTENTIAMGNPVPVFV